jgi:uncharacterized membrane protein (UPF0127 family)
MWAMGVRLERAAKKWELVFREKRATSATSRKQRALGDSVESLRALWAALAFVLFLAAPARVPARAGELDSLEIVTSTGRHAFQVEIASNDATREHGLMDRRYMAPDHGMLFEFDREAPVAFWMKNTYIPLDMIFIAPSGVVTHIAANAEPLSERVIPSGGPSVAVLELDGGMAASIGLKVGDKIRHPFFKP